MVKKGKIVSTQSLNGLLTKSKKSLALDRKETKGSPFKIGLTVQTIPVKACQCDKSYPIGFTKAR